MIRYKYGNYLTRAPFDVTNAYLSCPRCSAQESPLSAMLWHIEQSIAPFLLINSLLHLLHNLSLSGIFLTKGTVFHSPS